MKELPNISGDICKVIEHYIQSIREAYPESGDTDKYAIEFTKLWVDLQTSNAVTEYYRQIQE